MKKVIIIGSGPAGISAALYTVRAGLDTTILSVGPGSLEKAHAIQNFYGFPGSISGKELAEAGRRQAEDLGVHFLHEEVVGLTYENSLVVQTANGNYPADFVVMATGTARKMPPALRVAEYEGRGVSYCAVCDAFFYRGKHVAVLGNGEFALHEIHDLLPVAGSVTLLTNGEEPSFPLPEGVTADTRKIASLEGESRLEQVVFADGTSLPLDGLFIAYGTAGSGALARKIGAAVANGNVAVNENMETTVPGLYAAGDCVGGLLQVSKAVYEGAVAGNHIAKVSRKN